MLRAIAGYILGGILNDAPEENMECDAQEINDWLVVNMPNKPEENDFDLESETESVIDEDEILSCLSTLMSSEELQYDDDDSLVEEKKQITEIPTKTLTFYSSKDQESTDAIFSAIQKSAARYAFAGDFAFIDEKERTPTAHRAILPPQEIVECFPPKGRYIDTVIVKKANKKYLGLDEISECDKAIKIPLFVDLFTLDHRLQQKNGKCNRKLKERETQSKAKRSDLTCHYIQTPTYVNHRPPISAAKTDLLQQIKDLQPSQKAKEIAEKKLLTKSNLNRQNKNYIFCSSAKTNRRKDLQRNHSGANNNRNMNRKC